MKPATEMHEGPQALRRFEDTMKTLFSSKKADVLPERKTAPPTKKKSARPKA